MPRVVSGSELGTPQVLDSEFAIGTYAVFSLKHGYKVTLYFNISARKTNKSRMLIGYHRLFINSGNIKVSLTILEIRKIINIKLIYI